MIATADASFLVSLYGEDVNTPAAEEWMRGAAVPLWLTPFGWFRGEECVEALCFPATVDGCATEVGIVPGCRRTGRPGSCWSGIFRLPPWRVRRVLLSGQTTETQGGRAFDVLHVAAARLLGSDTFLSFDWRQRELAVFAGLTVAP